MYPDCKTTLKEQREPIPSTELREKSLEEMQMVSLYVCYMTQNLRDEAHSKTSRLYRWELTL